MSRFLLRRMVRIHPSYWIILLTVIGGTLLAPDLRGKIPADSWVLLKTFALVLQDAAGGGPTDAPAIIAEWMLHYGFTAYCVLAAFILSRALGIALVLTLFPSALQCSDGGCGHSRSFLASWDLSHFALWRDCRLGGASPAPLAPR